MIEVVAGELDRIVQNALLYTNPKAVRLREVSIVYYDNKLEIFACDDYIAIVDSCQVEGSTQVTEVAMDVETLENLGDWIKKDKKVIHKQKLKISFFNTYLKIKDEENDFEKFSFIKPNHESWDTVMNLLSEENEQKLILDFAVRPDRFAKLARLKADKEAPLMFRGIDINGMLVLQFKKGMTLSGAAMPIDQAYIKKEFLWENLQTDQRGTVMLDQPTDLCPNSTSTDSAPNLTD